MGALRKRNHGNAEKQGTTKAIHSFVCADILIRTGKKALYESRIVL